MAREVQSPRQGYEPCVHLLKPRLEWKGTTVPLLDQSDRPGKRYESRQFSHSDATWKDSCTFRDGMAYSYDFTPRGRDRGDSRVELFKTLEFKESRKRSLCVSVAVHGVLLSVLVLIPLLFTDTIKTTFNTVPLAPPVPKEPVLEVTHYKMPPPPKPVVQPKPTVAPRPPKPAGKSWEAPSSSAASGPRTREAQRCGRDGCARRTSWACS